MSWSAITEADVKTGTSGLELEGLRTQALADGQADPLPGVIAQVTDEIRGYVLAGGYPVGPASTLPPQLRSAARAMIRWRLGSRLPAPALQTEPRRKEYEDALTLCRDVAARKFKPEAPASAGPETQPAPAGHWGGQTKQTW
jgi:hypothetical protein